MAYTILSPSGLRVTDTGDPAWLTNVNYNFTLLNSTLLKLGAMQDVNVAGIANGNVLRYDTGTSKWIPWAPIELAKTTTTTTTTTA